LIGIQSCDDFVSVLDGNDEPELPVAMVCLITTLVGAPVMIMLTLDAHYITFATDLCDIEGLE
jgi:hypothetical protein